MKSLVNNARLAIIVVSVFCASVIALLWYKEAELLSNDKAAVIAQAVQRNSNLVLTLENYAIRTIQNAGLVLQSVKTAIEKSKNTYNYKEIFENPTVL